MPTAPIALLTLSLLAASASPVPSPEPADLTWFEGTWDELLQEASASERRVLVEFFTPRCAFCKRLETETFADEHVTRQLAGYLCFAVDAESDAGAKIAARFGVRTHPTLVWLDPDGTERDCVVGFLPPDGFLREARRIERGEGTLGALRRSVAAAPDDLDVRYALAKRLFDLGRLRAYQEQVDAIRERDPEGTSVASRWLRLRELRDEVSRNGYDLVSLRAFLAAETHGGILYEGWYAVWTVEDYLEQLAESDAERDAHRAACLAAGRLAWKHVPAEGRALLGPALVGALRARREHLGEADRAFALEVARTAVSAAPADARAHDALASAHALSGDLAAAVEAARRCVELAPENPFWRERLAELERELGGE